MAPKKLADQITQAKELVRAVTYSSRDLVAIATLTASLKVDGHRADLVILKAARAQAASASARDRASPEGQARRPSTIVRGAR